MMENVFVNLLQDISVFPVPQCINKQKSVVDMAVAKRGA
jgi:hypothetical protein